MLIINHNVITKYWCIYSLTKANESEPCFIWYCKVSKLLSLTDALKNPDFDKTANYTLSIISYHNNWIECNNALKPLFAGISGGMPVLNRTQWINRRTPVKCDQTGQVWNSQRDCAEQLGLNQAQLSQHLRRNPSYKTVKGMTFTNVSAAKLHAALVQYPAYTPDR